jgi:hypothetical protein
MRPYSDIKIGDVYKSIFGQLEWVVYNKNDAEKMVEILPLSNLPALLKRPLWKKNTDKIFTHRVMEGH